MGSEEPTYRVTITFKNEADWPVTFTGFKGQTGGDWDEYPPQVIDAKGSGSLSETLGEIADDAEGYVEYNLCDADNALLVDIKISWLSPHSAAGRESLFKWEMDGDDIGMYQITNTLDEGNRANVTFTLSKK
ncbi:hypothetical protein H072_1288 [Dactylellina haptotyla CBS 200.50]|uniref:Uncharacterized protein n=1 Tax=Dactylellina haptotyla (strain CBS 200.50) TaxID=1284197 RepID=S8CAG7_DACHA|nr:hypothetical protein H072_1288 [Dactylellina haptotyla CBS 200.50]